MTSNILNAIFMSDLLLLRCPKRATFFIDGSCNSAKVQQLNSKNSFISLQFMIFVVFLAMTAIRGH